MIETDIKDIDDTNNTKINFFTNKIILNIFKMKHIHFM